MRSARIAFETFGSAILSRKLEMSVYAYSSRVWNRTIISHNGNFLYQRIPKNANSTIVAALTNSFRSSENYKQRINIENILSISNIVILNKQIIEENFLKFVFLRDPLNRLKSAFVDKILINRSDNPLFNEIKVSTKSNFDNFVEILSNGVLMKNVHWMPQTKQIPFSLSKFDFIGTVENFDNDFVQLQSILNIRVHEVGRLNSSEKKYSINCSKKSRNLIENVFKDDYEAYFFYGKRRN